MAIWKGSHNPIIRGRMITMGIDLSLNGMIFQVPSKISSMEIRLIGLQTSWNFCQAEIKLGIDSFAAKASAYG